MNRLRKMNKSFAVSKKKAQEKVDLATNSADEDWLVITDIREGAKICPQYYCEMIVSKLCNHDKDVSLRALRLLELCARTCGIRFRQHVCKPAIIQSLYRIMKGNATEEVKQALYLLVKEWSYNEFANEPKLALISVLHYKLHPLWEGEKDDCCDNGKPNINNLCMEHILKSNQKTLIFKIFDEENPPTKQYYSQASGSSTNSNHLELNHKLSDFISDSESTNTDSDEEDMIAEVLAESFRNFESNQSRKPIFQRNVSNNIETKDSDDDYDEESMLAETLAESLRDSQSNQSKKSFSQTTVSNNIETKYSDSDYDEESMLAEALPASLRDSQSNQSKKSISQTTVSNNIETKYSDGDYDEESMLAEALAASLRDSQFNQSKKSISQTTVSKNSETESCDDDYDEESMMAKALAESLRDFQSKKSISQTTVSNNNEMFLSELQSNPQSRSREHESSFDSDRNKTPGKENHIELSCQNSPQNADSGGQQSSSSNPKKKLGKIRSKLECGVCFEFMSSAIFICENGHSVCGICNTRLEMCPFCRAVIRSRNYLLEELAETFEEVNVSRNAH